MNKTISASKAKNNLGYLLEEVYVRGRSITITKNNKPIAKVVPIYGHAHDSIVPALSLTDKEYDGIVEGTNEFRKTFKFSY